MLYETYRPKDWADVIAQDKAVTVLRRLEAAGRLAGKCFWVSGRSGTGKSSIGRIIASKVAEAGCIVEMDASGLTPALLNSIEEVQHFSECTPSAYIVNEARGLRRDTVRRLLVLAEKLRGHTTLIFTTTKDGEAAFEDSQIDAAPLFSRCIRLSLSQQGLAKPFAERVREIAIAEGLDGQPVEAYLRLAKNCGNNFRAMLQSVEAGEMLV